MLRWTTATGWFGDHTRTTPPDGGVVQTTWTDARGRQIRSDQGVPSTPSAAANTPGLVSTQLRRDDADRLVSSTDPAGHIATYRYDLIGRRIAATDPDARGSSSTFDGAGNLRTTTDALGVTVTTDYDALNRPVATWKGASGTGTKLSSTSYDATSVPNGIGRLASQTVFAVADSGKPFTAAVTAYDPRGRMTSRSWTFPAGTGGALIPLTCEIYDCTPAPQSDPCEIYDCTPANKDNSHLPGGIGEGGSPFTDKGCRPTDPFSPCSPTRSPRCRCPRWKDRRSSCPSAST